MDMKNKFEDIFDIGAEPAVSIVSSMFLDGVVGTVAPGVMSLMLAYKQKRSERMIEEFMRETRVRQSEVEEKLLALEEEDLKEVKGKYFGLVLDYVIETKQEEKIKYIVNGFINLTEIKKLKEDVVLIYYDLLDGLNILDIRVLKIYSYNHEIETYSDIIEDANISYEQYELIQNKLKRLGLLETNGQSQYEEMFGNVKNMGEFLNLIEKGKKAKLKFKKPGAGRLQSYKLTRLGRDFLVFFAE